VQLRQEMAIDRPSAYTRKPRTRGGKKTGNSCLAVQVLDFTGRLTPVVPERGKKDGRPDASKTQADALNTREKERPERLTEIKTGMIETIIEITPITDDRYRIEMG